MTTWLSALASASFAVLLTGCGSKVIETGQVSADDSPTAEAVPCDSDDDCTGDTFSDLGECAAFYEPRHYGWPCNPDWISEAEPKSNPCGGYICRDLKCRSCDSSTECKAGGCYDGATYDPALTGSSFITPGWVCGAAPAR